jgi:hypothetical protein
VGKKSRAVILLDPLYCLCFFFCFLFLRGAYVAIMAGWGIIG